jgi:hypothetical protein
MATSAEVDCKSPIVVALVFMRSNPHDLIVQYRQQLRWACFECKEDGASALFSILKYDKEFGRCPDSTTTLKTWLSANVKNDQRANQEQVQKFQDIDLVDEYEVDGDLPAVEVVIDSFLAEARVEADNTTYHDAQMILTGASIPKEYMKLAETLAPPELAMRYTRDRWSKVPVVRPVIDGDWVENADNISQELDTQLLTQTETRIKTLYTDIDENLVIGKKDLRWIGILGYTNHGKSTFLYSLLYNMARSGHNILLIPREISVAKVWIKLTWLHSKWFPDMPLCSYDTWGLKPHLVTDEDRATKDFLFNDLKSRRHMAGSIDVKKMSTWEDIEEYVKDNQSKKHYDVIALDYAEHLDVTPARGQSKYDAQNEMFRRIQMFGQDFNGGEGMCIITPLQTNKHGMEVINKKDGELWGVYEPSDLGAVDYFTQVAHDMDIVIGVWKHSDDVMIISCPKARGKYFPPFTVGLDSAKSRYVFETRRKYDKDPTVIMPKSKEFMDHVADLLEDAF